MVGRSKRLTAKDVARVVTEEVVTEDDDDIVCLDDPPQQSKKRGVVRNMKAKQSKMKEPDKNNEEQENIFAGINLEGVSEEEKVQIKEALLASAKEVSSDFDSTDEANLNSSRNTSNECRVNVDTTDLSETEAEEAETEGNKTLQNQPMGVDDDDETQPPTDTDSEEQINLHLEQSTLEEARSEESSADIFDMGLEDADSTLREESEDVTANRLKRKDIKTSSPLPKPEQSSEDDLTGMSSNIPNDCTTQDQVVSNSQVDEPDDSQGFAPELQTDNQTKAEVSDTVEQAVPQATSPTDISESLKESSSQKSESQRSFQPECKLPESPGSQRSLGDASKPPESSRLQRTDADNIKQSTSTSCQNIKEDVEHVPLKRHYRGVKLEFQRIKHDQYFGDASVKGLKKIYLQFETFRKRLYEEQRKLKAKLGWPEPVKVGQHQSRTIDLKRRGRDSQYCDLSDSDDGNDQQTRKTDRLRRLRNGGSSDKDSDKDLPELIIECDNDTERHSRHRYARRGLHSKPVEKEIMSADTQPYDVDNDDDDFVLNPRSRYGRLPKVGASKDTSGQCANDEEKTGIKESLTHRIQMRTRSSRKLGLNAEQSGDNILAEETQEQRDLREAIKRSKTDTNEFSLRETQIGDDDLEWLSIKKQNGKDVFENQMHVAKLKGYSIPKRVQVHSKSHSKIEERVEINEDQPDLKSRKDCSELNKDQLESKQKIENRQGNENIAPPVRGRKRKAKKQVGVTLVEDTQDQEAEEVPRDKRSRRKRDCFRIETSSESEDESVAESQDIDGPSERKEVVNDNDEGSKSPVISKKRQNVQSGKPACDRDKTESTVSSTSDSYVHSFCKKFNRGIKAESKTKEHSDSDEIDLTEEQDILKSSNRFGEKDFIEENNISEGVKRFVSRPSSKESNASDNISLTSSQMSSNILDEEGDIYPTQYCEIRARKGKDGPQTDERKVRLQNKDVNIPEVLKLDSDDEFLLKKSQKTYSVKGKTPVVKSATIVEKSAKIQAYRKEYISQYFGSAPVEGDENVPIDLDPDIVHEEAGHALRDKDNSKEEGLNIKVTEQASRGNSARPQVQHVDSTGPPAVEQKFEMVECPLCYYKFPSNIIQQHAAACVGPPDQTAGEPEREEYGRRVAAQQTAVPQDETLDKTHRDPVGGGSQGHPHDGNARDDAQVLRRSLEEEGETVVCVICDAVVPKGQPFSAHKERCLRLATQQQEELEKMGYNRAFNEAEPEEALVRTLRGRQINPTERGNTPRASRRRAHHSPLASRASSDPDSPSSSGRNEHVKMVTIDEQSDESSEEPVVKRMRRGHRDKPVLNIDRSSGHSR